MSSLSTENYCKYGSRPACSFVLGCAATKVLAPSVADMYINIKGNDIPVWVFGGISAAVGTLLGQLATDYLSPHVTQLSALNAPLHSALNVGIQTSGTALAYSMAIGSNWSNDISLLSVVGVAAISECGSSYLTENWIKPAVQQYNM